MCIPIAQGVGANGIVVDAEIIEVRGLPRWQAQYRAVCSRLPVAVVRRAEIHESYSRRFWCEFFLRHIAPRMKRQLVADDASLPGR
jgi:hypothetical protein